MKHFRGTLTSYPRDVEDSLKAQMALQEQTPAFTDEQRHTLAAAISAHMVHETVSQGGNSKLQTNVHCHHYLNDTAWSVVYDKSFAWATKKGKIY